jgi:hypothetical protein
MRSPSQKILSEESLEVLSPEEIHAMETELSETVENAREARDRLSRNSEILYSIRNITLATGIILLLLAKSCETLRGRRFREAEPSPGANAKPRGSCLHHVSGRAAQTCRSADNKSQPLAEA